MPMTKTRRNRAATVQPKSFNTLKAAIDDLEKQVNSNPLLSMVSEDVAQAILSKLHISARQLESNVAWSQTKVINLEQGSKAKEDQLIPDKILEYCQRHLELVTQLEVLAHRATKAQRKIAS